MDAFLPEAYIRVLEIGCGDGSFSAALDGAAERWGVEMDPDSAARAAARLDRVIEGSYSDITDELPRSYFDLVLCNDVIEHMEDHDLFLDSVRDMMRDGGSIVGSVPNVRYYRNLKRLLFDGDWRYSSQGVLDRDHLRFFTMKSLRRTLHEHRFRIHRLEGINPESFRPGDPASLFLYLSVALTFGAMGDTRYLQFGFRAEKI